MTVIIQGVDPPKSCTKCKLKVYDYFNEHYVCPFLNVPALHRGKHTACPVKEQSYGEWGVINDVLDIYICENCGEVFQIQQIPIWKYCPMCGAMKGEKNE